MPAAAIRLATRAAACADEADVVVVVDDEVDDVNNLEGLDVELGVDDDAVDVVL